MILTRSSLTLSLPPALDLSAGTHVTIGNFDGVHLGHQALLARTRERAAREGCPAVAVTFEPHPLEVLTPHAPPRLTTTPARLALLEAAGMDLVLLVRFTREFAAMTPEAFVRRLLLDGLRMRRLSLGHDFSLGRGRSGTPERLAAIGRSSGFSVHTLAPFTINGATVSSTRVRELLLAGRPREAAALLGRPHAVRGEVVHGLQRGGTLGVPTANLTESGVMLPRPGVYATLASLPPASSHLPALHAPLGSEAACTASGTVWPAVTNIGHNPTFGPAGLSVETHLLGFSGDLYGRQLEVAFVERLRDEVAFSGPDELVAQIAADVRKAEQVLADPASSRQ